MQLDKAKAILEIMFEYANEKDAVELRDGHGYPRNEEALDPIAQRFADLMP